MGALHEVHGMVFSDIHLELSSSPDSLAPSLSALKASQILQEAGS
jgi:hypothetical protein